MKKIIAVLVAGTFIIGSVVAQTPATSAKPATRATPATPAQPAEKKSTVVASHKEAEKNDATGNQKPDGKMKHHNHMKGKVKKTETKSMETKSLEKK